MRHILDFFSKNQNKEKNSILEEIFNVYYFIEYKNIHGDFESCNIKNWLTESRSTKNVEDITKIYEGEYRWRYIVYLIDKKLKINDNETIKESRSIRLNGDDMNRIKEDIKRKI